MLQKSNKRKFKFPMWRINYSDKEPTMNYQGMQSFILDTFNSLRVVDEKKSLFDNFLGTLQAPEHSLLLESIRAGCHVLLENERDLRAYQKLSSEIMDGVVSAFQKEGGNEMTRRLMKVISGEEGKVTVDPIGGFGLVRSFKYFPTGIPTETDKEGAKQVLISSVFPMILQKARDLLKRSHSEESAHDFILQAMTILPGYLDRFQYKGSSFLNAFLFELKNLTRDGLAKANHIGTASHSWKRGADVAKNKILSYSGQNYRARHDIYGSENNKPPIEATDLYDPVGTSRKNTVSLDNPTGDDETQLYDKIDSPNFTAQETEDKGELARFMKLLSDGPQKTAIDLLYGITSGTPLSDVDTASKMGLSSRTAVHALVKRGLEQIRTKAKIPVLIAPTEAKIV